MREADRVFREFSAEDEVELLGRYITLRQALDLPRIYNHPVHRQQYVIDGRTYTFKQLARRVDRLEDEALQAGKAAA